MFPTAVFKYVPPTPAAVPATQSGLKTRLVAAIRWDFEIGMLSRGQIIRKYEGVAGPWAIRGIVGRTMDPDIAPRRGYTTYPKPKHMENDK